MHKWSWSRPLTRYTARMPVLWLESYLLENIIEQKKAEKSNTQNNILQHKVNQQQRYVQLRSSIEYKQITG